MKTSPLLSTGVLAGFVVLTRYNALADLDVWDGGSGSSNNISAELNWADNTSPVSDLQNTDLIFRGANRLMPVVDLLTFRVHSVTFFEVAGSFVISGQTLNVGELGVGNEDNGMMTFTNPVSFSGVTDSIIDARDGPLTFANTVTLPTDILRVYCGHSPFGENISFSNIAGTGALHKDGPGEMTWTPNVVTNVDVTVNEGPLTMGADGGTDVFSAAAAIEVKDLSDLNLNESLTLSGARLTRDFGGGLSLAAGKTLTVENGGDVVIDGAFNHDTASAILVTGAGSTFSTSISFGLNGGSTTSITAGGSVQAGGAFQAFDGTAAVSGIGSSLSGDTLDVGTRGSVTFSGGSTGTFEWLRLAENGGSGSTANLLIQGGATVNVNALLEIATDSVPVSGGVTITGNGSMLAFTGTLAAEVGAASSSTGVINVNSGGTLSGSFRVYPTGIVAINDGVFSGSATLLGGQLTRSAGGVIAPGSFVTVESGGDAIITGSCAATGGTRIGVRGSGATFTTTADLTINTGSFLSIFNGGHVSTGPGAFRAGTLGNGTVTIDGAGATLTLPGAATATIGANAFGIGSLTIVNGGAFQTGTGVTTVNTTGTLAITNGTCDVNGDLTINGGRLTRDAAGTLVMDAARTLRVQAGGDAVFTGAFVRDTASPVVVTGAGSTLSTINGGLGVRGGGTLSVAAGGSVSADAAGLASIGAFGGNGSVTVDGAGSNFSGGSLMVGFGAAGSLEFQNSSNGMFAGISVADANLAGTSGTLGIRSGATLSATNIVIASTAAAATGMVTVSGTGSTLTLTGLQNTNIGAASASSGTLRVESGGTLVSGNGLTNVNATGALIVNAGGTLTGASDFGGSGPITMAGRLVPGTASGANQTTSASFAQNIALQPTSSIRMEIGGTAAGTAHDQIVFNGPGATHVTWNGVLQVVLINGFTPQAGQSFDLFNFDPARDAGAFTTTNLPALPAGLFWRTDRLYIDGTIGVRGPGTYAEWRAAFGTGAFNADDDGDGFTNGVEFLLGTNPKQRFPSGERPWTELPPVDSATDTRAGVTFSIPADPASDAFYRLFASSNMVNWVLIARKDGDGPWSGTATVTADPPAGGRTRLTITESLPRGTSPRYHRLDAIEPP